MTKNRVTGIFALVLSVIYLAATSTIEITAVSDPIGPRVFPVIIGVGLFLIGLLLVMKKETLTAKNRAVVFTWATEKELIVNIGLTCVAGVIFGLILEPLGYLLATTLFMTAMMFITNRNRVIYNCAIALTFSLTTYGIFFGLLEVSLPRGILAF